MGLTEAQTDLATLDQLRPRLRCLQRLGERANDTEFALGSDVMATSLKAYAVLKGVSKNQRLESLRNARGVRFARTPRQVEPKAA